MANYCWSTSNQTENKEYELKNGLITIAGDVNSAPSEVYSCKLNKGESLEWVWFWSTVTQMGPSHLHEVFLFVSVLEHLCVLTSLMENLGLGIGWEWRQQEARAGFNHRSGKCKVFSILDALESHWLCSLAQGQNKETEVPRTVTAIYYSQQHP